jgi:hypothetical protein
MMDVGDEIGWANGRYCGDHNAVACPRTSQGGPAVLVERRFDVCHAELLDHGGPEIANWMRPNG